MKFSFASILLASTLIYAQEPDDDVRPSPPSIGADVPVTYFGPPPSTVQKELIGPLQLLTAGQLDEDEGTITLPLYMGRLRSGVREAKTSRRLRRGRGSPSEDEEEEEEEEPESEFVEGKYIWYILTDTTDLGIAQGLGLNHAPKIRFANVNSGTRWAEMGTDNIVNFDEASLVDFRPARQVIPGAPPNYFPPTRARPGQIGLNGYSPLMYLSNLGESFNAPVVADADATEEDLNRYCDGVPAPGGPGYIQARRILHDRVMMICPREQTVKLSLSPGFSFGRPVLYLSADAIDATTAALEQATYAPGLLDIEVGDDDSFGSSVERIFVVANGQSNSDIPAGLQGPGVNHPQRQGLNSALQGDGPPLNVLGGIPTIATDYSPLWDVNLGMWTQDAIDAGFRSRWLEEFQILGFVERGFVTGPGGAPFGSTGNIVNCPIVHRFL